MAFVKLGGDYIKEGFTQVDNVFLMGYLPGADATDVKIYLYGLTLAGINGEEENQLQKMAISLRLSEERIMESYRYWENKGLVSVSKTNPVSISYLSVKRPLTPVIKVNAEEYKPFVEEVNRLFPQKILSPNEFNAYIEFMQTEKMPIDAMLLIMQYCYDLKGGNANTPYVLAVAADWAKKGVVEEKAVDEHIKELENNSETIREIFKALGIKRAADLDDRQLYLKWTNEMGFTAGAIIAACKPLKKRGGMERLDLYLTELASANAFNPLEIAEYAKGKEQITALAVDVAKQLGTYYGSVDALIDTYVMGWLHKGFDGDAVRLMAKFCFLRNIRSFDGLDQMVEKFYSLSLLTKDGIESFIGKQIAEDSEIKKIFAKVDYIGSISNKDRESYRMWLDWGFGEDVISYVAELNRNKPFPMQSMNRVLSDLHLANAQTLPEAQAKLTSIKKKEDKPVKEEEDFLRHVYTDEELKGVLTSFDKWGK